MAKRVRDANLETRTARDKLTPSGKPYYKAIGPGLHIGYRKGKRGGSWVVRRYLGEGDYRVETIDGIADDREDANGKEVLDFWQAQEKARALRVDSSAAKPAGPYTVASALDDYLDFLTEHRKSADSTRYRIEALIKPELGKVEVAKLTAERIRTWLTKLATTPQRLRTRKGEGPRYRDALDDAESVRKRRSSANRTLTVLKAALNHAWNEKRVTSRDAWQRVKPYKGVDAARVRYLSVAEAQRLINAADPDLRRLIEAALQTGARYGELTRLRASDFNRDVGTLTITDSKSGRPRHIVLTEEGIDLFTGLTAGRGHNDIILTKADGTLWGKSHQARPVAEASQNARISPPINFHSLRHTWASHAVMNGVPLMVVAKNLGHSDTRMVEKHYGHLAPSYVADAIRAGAPRFGVKAESKIERLG